MWLYGKTDPQSYPVDFSILRLGLNKDEHPSRCGLSININISFAKIKRMIAFKPIAAVSVQEPCTLEDSLFLGR